MSQAHPLQQGDVIRLEKGHWVQLRLPMHFAYANHVGDFTSSEKGMEVRIGREAIDTYGLDTSFLAGLYVVTQAAIREGQSSQHDGYYPGGNRVWCEKVDAPKGLQVEFYEAGSWGAVNSDIEPMGKARMTMQVDLSQYPPPPETWAESYKDCPHTGPVSRE